MPGAVVVAAILLGGTVNGLLVSRRINNRHYLHGNLEPQQCGTIALRFRRQAGRNPVAADSLDDDRRACEHMDWSLGLRRTYDRHDDLIARAIARVHGRRTARGRMRRVGTVEVGKDHAARRGAGNPG